MLTVNGDRDVVERQLGSGELACPLCGGVLGGWGNAVTRPVRQLEGADELVRPLRSRCRACRATHVLLPVRLLCRRADAGAVIGRALEESAAGAGHRKIAGLLGPQAAHPPVKFSVSEPPSRPTTTIWKSRPVSMTHPGSGAER